MKPDRSKRRKREQELVTSLMDLRAEADKLDCYKTRDNIDGALREVAVEIASVRTQRKRYVKE